VFQSPYPRIAVPSHSVYDHLFGSLDESDLERVALIDPATGDETTYGRLRAQVDAFAGALAHRGVGTDTVIALLCPNIPAFATVFHGILRLGAVVTTVNSLYTAHEIETQLTDAGATWLVTVSPVRRGTSTCGLCSPSSAPRPRSTSTRRRTWRSCRTRQGRRACRRASCSRTATSSPTSTNAA